MLRDVPPQNLVIQPKNIGTAPAILYSLLRLEQRTPAASVAFFPSDHYFSDNRIFISHIETAFDAVRLQRGSDSNRTIFYHLHHYLVITPDFTIVF